MLRVGQRVTSRTGYGGSHIREGIITAIHGEQRGGPGQTLGGGCLVVVTGDALVDIVYEDGSQDIRTHESGLYTGHCFTLHEEIATGEEEHHEKPQQVPVFVPLFLRPLPVLDQG